MEATYFFELNLWCKRACPPPYVSTNIFGLHGLWRCWSFVNFARVTWNVFSTFQSFPLLSYFPYRSVRNIFLYIKANELVNAFTNYCN